MRINTDCVPQGLLIFILSILIAGFSFSAVSEGAAQPPLVVNSIEVTGNHQAGVNEINYLMNIRTGEPFTRDDVTIGIRRLFRKGLFERISVERDEQDAKKLRIDLKEKDYIDAIVIKGNRFLSRTYLEARLPFKEGDVLRRDLFPLWRKHIVDLLERKGYPGSAVTITTQKTRRPNLYDVRVNIVEANPVRVETVEVLGQYDYPPGLFERMLRIRQDSVYDQLRIEDEMQKIERFLLKKGHYNPKVGPYTFYDGTLIIGVSPGGKLHIRARGNNALSVRSMKKVMPFFDAAEVSDELIQDAVENIRELYAKRGFTSVQIAPVVVQEGKDKTLTFYVYEGVGSRVRNMSITSEIFDEKRLLEAISLKKRAKFSPQTLETDQARLKSFLVALGYLNATVSSRVTPVTERMVDIEILVDEGPKTELEHIQIFGAEDINPSALKDALGLREGDPYNEVDISDARQRALDYCKSLGYFFCTVAEEHSVVDMAGQVKFQVDPGARFFFGKTIISGNTRTRRRLLLRHIRYDEGAPLNANLIDATKRSLRRTGLFSDVQLQPLNPTAQNVSDIDLQVSEGKPGSMEFGFGYGEYERYRGFIDLSYRNFFGMQRKGSLRTEQSTLWSRYILSFEEPRLFEHDILSRTFLVREIRKEKNIDTGAISYRVKKTSFNTGIERQFTRRIRGTLYYQFSLVDTYDVAPDVVLSKEDTGTLAIGSITPSIVHDSRDEPFDPSSGTLASITVKIASEQLASDTQFVKSNVHLSLYDLYRKRFVVALSLRGGMAYSYGDTQELPIVERFFLGGRNTVRGFRQDSLGPVGPQGTPIGGNSFLLGNIEIRVRLTEGWRVVPFYDTGNVWTKRDEFSISDLRSAAGLGIQYNTPVGPVRLDYGWKIKPRKGESASRLHFSLGHAF